MSNIVNLPPNSNSGLYHAPPHSEGGVQVIIDGVKPIEVEGFEVQICNSAMESTEVFEFKNKTNKQILDKLFVEEGCVFEQGKAESGDFIVCKLVVLDEKKRDIKGTPKEILNILQKEKSCRMSGDKVFQTGGKLPLTEEEIEIMHRRWSKKKEHIESLANNIQRLRYNVTEDLKSENEKIFLTALVVALMDKTAERVGNDASASNGHFGITGLKKKHVRVKGNEITLEYVGKSGVEHEKTFSSEKLSSALTRAISSAKGRNIFATSTGDRVRAERVNNYLSDFDVTAKDIRGYSANKWIIEKLHKTDVSEEEKDRKKTFKTILKSISEKVGHEAATLRKHYLLPELMTEYIEHGIIIDLKIKSTYDKGGDLKPDEKKPADCGCVHENKDKFLFGGKILFRDPISDKEYSFKKSIDEIYQLYTRGLDTILGNLINHKELFKNFPDLSKIKVKFVNIEDEEITANSSTEFIKTDRQIVINLALHFNYLKITGHEKYELKTTSRPELSKEGALLHELQHVLQRKARRGTGRSYDSILETLHKRTPEITGNAGTPSDGLLGLKFQALLIYKQQFPEQEAMLIVFHWLKSIELNYGDTRYIDFDLPKQLEQEGSQKGHMSTGGSIKNPIIKSFLFERPDMENPVHKVIIDKKEHYIQRQDNMNSGSSWIEVIKKDNVWETVQHHDTYPEIGSNKQEAIDWLVNKHNNPSLAKGGDLTKTHHGLLAPNGKPSNLNPVQYKIVRTNSFTKWFGNWEALSKAKALADNVTGLYKKLFPGNEEKFLFEMAQQANTSKLEHEGAIKVAGKELIDLALLLYPHVIVGDKFYPAVSKVVDDNGEPAIKYHGTTGDFSELKTTTGEFGGGIYFGNKDDANYFANVSAGHTPNSNQNILPVFLSIKNPIVYSVFRDKKTLPVRTKLIKKGYNGVFGYTANDTLEIVAFYPNQIKSAIANIGTFNIESNSILLAKGGDLENPNKSGNFEQDEIRNDISGKSEVGDGKSVQAASNYFRTIEGSGSLSKEEQYFNKQEAASDFKYIISDPKPDDHHYEYKKRNGVLFTVTPQEFLDVAAPLKLNAEEEDKISNLMEKIILGTPMNPAHLNIRDFEVVYHDGRHRAIACQRLGIMEYPVIVMDEEQIKHNAFEFEPQVPSIYSNGGEVKKGKKIIRRNLPINKTYKLIDSYYTGGIMDNPHTCENCGRPIANVAVIQDEDGKKFDVGMDCAETLAGIKNTLEYNQADNDFKEATAIRTKINKVLKKYPDGIMTISNNPGGYVYVEIRSEKGLYLTERIEKQFLSKYLPDLKTKIVNPEKNDFYPRYEDNYPFDFDFKYFATKIVDPKTFVVGDYTAVVSRQNLTTLNVNNLPITNNYIVVDVTKGADVIGQETFYMYNDVPRRIIDIINKFEFDKYPEPILLAEGGDIEPVKRDLSTYHKRVNENIAYMDSQFADWRAIPIIGYQKTPNAKGVEIDVPVFDFPKNYANAVSLFPMNTSGSYCCELCGKTPINTIYWLQNDNKKMTLRVGSECVSYFGEGKSGKENLREAKINLAKMLDNDVINLSRIISGTYRKTKIGGYGRTETSWGSSTIRGWEGNDKMMVVQNQIAAINPKHLFEHPKRGDYNTAIYWRYVYGIMPTFGYQTDLVNVKRGLYSQETADKNLLSWFTRNEKKAVEIIKEVVSTLVILGNDKISEYKSDYIESKNDSVIADDTINMAKGGGIPDSVLDPYYYVGVFNGTTRRLLLTQRFDANQINEPAYIKFVEDAVKKNMFVKEISKELYANFMPGEIYIDELKPIKTIVHDVRGETYGANQIHIEQTHPQSKTEVYISTAYYAGMPITEIIAENPNALDWVKIIVIGGKENKMKLGEIVLTSDDFILVKSVVDKGKMETGGTILIELENIPTETISEESIQKGILNEMEHCNTIEKIKANPDIAVEEAVRMLVIDHLNTDKNYYDGN